MVHQLLEFFLANGSYLLLFSALILAGMGVPLPEDIVFIAGAILAQQGRTDVTLTLLVLTAGVLLGDTVLFFLAKKLGERVYKFKVIERWMPEPRRRWLENKIKKHGGVVVFCARHVAGLRGPTFAVTAIHGLPYHRFIFWDAIALLISLPIFFAVGYFFAENIERLMSNAETAQRGLLVAAALVIVLVGVGHFVSKKLRGWISATSMDDGRGGAESDDAMSSDAEGTDIEPE